MRQPTTGMSVDPALLSGLSSNEVTSCVYTAASHLTCIRTQSKRKKPRKASPHSYPLRISCNYHCGAGSSRMRGKTCCPRFSHPMPENGVPSFSVFMLHVLCVFWHNQQQHHDRHVFDLCSGKHCCSQTSACPTSRGHDWYISHQTK